MEQLITHTCGHEQAHYLNSFASHRNHKTQRLKTTKNPPCFVIGNKTAQADAALRDGAAIHHLDLPPLTVSERQVNWATSVRASRLASLIAGPDDAETNASQTCILITDAEWWIDHPDLASTEILTNEGSYVGAASIVAKPVVSIRLHQVA